MGKITGGQLVAKFAKAEGERLFDLTAFLSEKFTDFERFDNI